MKHLPIISAALLTFLAAGCNGGSNSLNDQFGGDTVTTTAQLLTIIDYPSYSVAEIRDPWDSTRVMAKYILAPHTLPSDSLPDGTVVRTPLEHSLIYSGVHGGAINELGEIKRIAAVTDGQYFTLPALTEAIKKGDIKDVGSSMSPSIEAIIELSPDAILTAPYQNSGHGAIETLHIPIVEMADYMEQSPLGRAEWIKLLGRLYGQTEKSDSIYDAVTREYNKLRELAATTTSRPMVLTEIPYNGVWSLPGGNSYAARLIADAGGKYAWADNPSAGSIELDPAAVLDRCEHADLWLIRSYGPMTLSSLKSDLTVSDSFDAFRYHNIYICDTSSSSIFEEVPFHPELLLSQYLHIFHPELSSAPMRNYYLRAL